MLGGMGDDASTEVRQGGSYPDWYHEDNLFPSRERMDQVHAPIAAEAVAALAGRGGNVLDLGCGNGALLGKIHRAAEGVVPFGVDVVDERVAHARGLLPRFAGNFVTADLFEPSAWWPGDRRFALVVLSPRRLEEAGLERSARLKEWLRPRCDQLLIYAYGKGLTQFGDLAGFAGEVGIRLAKTQPGITASLAAHF